MSAGGAGGVPGRARICELIVVLFASLVFILSIISPPSLMDDVDAVQAQISRNMMTSGDWVTAHLDGVAYLEKSPLVYWMMALSFKLFGVHDWAARLPIALSAVAFCWIFPVCRMGHRRESGVVCRTHARRRAWDFTCLRAS